MHWYRLALINVLKRRKRYSAWKLKQSCSLPSGCLLILMSHGTREIMIIAVAVMIIIII